MAEKHVHDENCEHDHHDESIALPPAAQNLLVQLQTFQQQYQSVAVQREALAMQKMEMDKALDELAKTNDKDEVFKAVGPVLIKSTKTELEKEMSERKESIGARLAGLESQEKKIRERMSETQQKLQALLGGKKNEAE